MNLVTVEAQAYGPESLVGIKVVEHVTTIPLTGEKVVPTTSQASIQQQMEVQQPATLVCKFLFDSINKTSSHMDQKVLSKGKNKT